MTKQKKKLKAYPRSRMSSFFSRGGLVGFHSMFDGKSHPKTSL
jgi:hypothetical protein